MAYAAQGNISDLPIGLYLKIFSAKGVYNNLSEASEMWKMFLKRKAADAKGREHRFNLRSGYGMGAAQFVAVGGSPFPRAKPSVLNEGVALFKSYSTTISVPFDLLDKGEDDLAVYGQPLAEELDSKGLATARMLSVYLYGDGSGAVGRINSVAVDTTNDVITVGIIESDAEAGRSNMCWILEDDDLKFATAAGVANGTINNTATAVGYWQVVSKDLAAQEVVLKPYTSAGVAINITTATLGATDPTVNDYLYRIGITPNDLSAITSSDDYNSLSEAWAGLDSLTADDGRLVNNIRMSGVLGGSRQDAEQAILDYSHFQAIMSKTKNRVGKGRHKWDSAILAYQAYDAIMQSGETDRRFMAKQNLDRGTQSIVFQHDKDAIELITDEFCPTNRVIIPPTSKECLQFIGRDFSFVEPNPGQKFQIATSSEGAGYARNKMAFLDGSGTVVGLQAAAIGVITNFTLPGQP